MFTIQLFGSIIILFVIIELLVIVKLIKNLAIFSRFTTDFRIKYGLLKHIPESELKVGLEVYCLITQSLMKIRKVKDTETQPINENTIVLVNSKTYPYGTNIWVNLKDIRYPA